ncbi:MAG: ABC transporter ATP-binding protein [Candidatus Promineifilaceae bacterium]
MNEPVLSTHEVTKEYELDDQIITAVDRVSLELYQGEFVALVGPSGSGKTTMLAMIAGLLTPTSGEICLRGDELGQMKESKRARIRRERIGFTFQAHNLVNYLTALENVELMLRLNSRFDDNGQQRAITLLERLGLGDRLHNLPQQLSGGQRQRVAIARSVIHEPQLVLADEPTASLDTALAFQVVETFADLIHEQNRTGIMVTHDLRMVRYCDRVIQMQDGRLQGTISDRAEIDEMAHSQYRAAPEPSPTLA